ncbi:hypothetical protein P7C71_g315, partial [Lecanoromycetidae sp. Uapishka_2]
MRSQSLLRAALAVAWIAAPVSSQTSSTCNPLTSGSCPADTALGKAVTIDFTAGQSDSFTTQGSPTYDSNGASFTVAKSGDSPLIESKWYIMFGHVEFVLKAAPGVGIVSSAILQSDDLDEIDFEWLGYDDNNVQSNYFGKGLTTTYNRGVSSPAPGNHDGFHTYAIDWTADQIVWSVNGATVRTLTPAATNGYPYPQTPMMIKVGAWSGGDSSNPVGTQQWATGQTGVTTNYASGPYTMQLKSIAVTDYSTGSQYTYSGTEGTWQSITAFEGVLCIPAKCRRMDSNDDADKYTSHSDNLPGFASWLDGDKLWQSRSAECGIYHIPARFAYLVAGGLAAGFSCGWWF